jgi:hypothetical protein
MQKRVLMLTTSAFILACGAVAGSAQQGPMMQQPQIPQQQKQDIPARSAQDDRDQGSDITGWDYGPGWRHHREMGFGMMRRGAMMGGGGMPSGVMMRMLFAMMDSDGDGTVSLQEFQTAHERIFKAMDTNKDGVLTLEEIQAFMQGTRTPAPRH